MSTSTASLLIDASGRPIPQWYDNVADVYRPISTAFPGPSTTPAGGTGNTDTAALITHSAASAGVNGADQANTNSRGVQIGINVTAITGTTPTLLVTVQGKDAASGVYYNLLVSASITATGFTLLTIYPGGPNTANVAIPQVLPKTWRVITTIGGTTPAVTATIGASVIL